MLCRVLSRQLVALTLLFVSVIFLCGLSCGRLFAQQPSPPTGLTATPLPYSHGTQVQLTWNIVAGATSYNIYRATSSGGEGNNPVVTNPTVTADGTQMVSYINTDLITATTYYYEVSEVTSGNLSNRSNQVSATTGQTALSPPAYLSAQGPSGQANVVWMPVSGANLYVVYRSVNGGGFSYIAITPQDGYSDTSVTNGQTYAYEVAAQCSSSTSAPSAPTQVIPGATLLPGPTTVNATPGNNQVYLQWSPVAGATSYNIWRTASGQTFVFIQSGLNPNTFLDTGVTNGTDYEYNVSGENQDGSGSTGTPVYVTPSSTTPPEVSSFSITPASITGGYAGTGSLTIDEAAPTGGAIVTLTSLNTSVLQCPASVTVPTGSTSATFQMSTSNPPANTLVSVTVAAGSVPITSSVTVTPHFIVDVPAAATVSQGQSSLSAIALVNAYQFSGSVILTASGLPTGVTAAFSPGSISGSQTSNLTLTVSPTAAAATTAITITGTSGSLVNTATINLTVAANPILTSITVSPAAVTIPLNATQQFNAVGNDQFGTPLVTPPTFTWSLANGAVGSISSSGLYSSVTIQGTDTVNVASGSVAGSATATVAATSPTLVTAASASPSTVTGTTTALSALGASDLGAGNLTYTWATTGTPPAAVTFSANGTNAAQNTTATFTAAGSYSLQVAIADSLGLSTTSDVTVTVNQTVTSVTVTPQSAEIGFNATQQLEAVANDQFGAPLVFQPTITWSLPSGAVGTISSAGVYASALAGGTDTVTAAAGSVTGTAAVTVADQPPAVVTAASANPSPVTGTVAILSATGSSDLGSANLTYTWATMGTPPFPVAFIPNGTNGAQVSTAFFADAGTYNLQVTISDPQGQSITSAVTVIVDQSLDAISVTPYTANIPQGGMQQFAAQALDQFWNPMATQPPVIWSVLAPATGAVSAQGLYTAGSTVGTDTVQASASNVAGNATVNVQLPPPSIVMPAAASPNPVMGMTTQLSVLGGEGSASNNLSYTWSQNANAPAPVIFSSNGSTSASNTTATFSAPGQYLLQVTITDPAGNIAASSVSVLVDQQISSIVIAPATTSIMPNGTAQFTASAKDQFGIILSTQPTFIWSLATGAVGAISTAGLYTAGANAGTDTVQATAGGVAGSATISVASGPIITSIAPTSGPVGTVITITGTGLQNVNAITFGNGVVNNIYGAWYEVSPPSITSTSITMAVPYAAGSGPITVATLTSSATSSQAFNLTNGPTITSISPPFSSLPLSYGAGVDIHGTGFEGVQYVMFNGLNVAFYEYSPNLIEAYPGLTGLDGVTLTSGPVTVITSAGVAVSPTNFTVTSTYPEVTSVTPAGGPVGSSVTIIGVDLSGASEVGFTGPTVETDDGPASRILYVQPTAVSATSITAIVPIEAVTGPLRVQTPNGTATSAVNFCLPPTMTSFFPMSGPVGSWVAINGTNLQDATSASIANVPTNAMESGGSQQLLITVASGTGTGPIVVTTPGGTATSSTNFNIGPAAPTISSVTGGDSSVYVAWAAVPNAASYNVYRATTSSGKYMLVNKAAVTATAFLDAGPLTNSAPYFYEVTAVSSGGIESMPSAPVYGLPNIHVNCGGNSYFSTGTWVQWAGDYGNIGGGTDSTGSTIANTADPTLFQTERSGASFTYSFPVRNGSYTLTLGFSENDGNTAGQRTVSVIANGAPLATNLDVFASAGAANTAFTLTKTIYITGGYLNLSFSGNTAEIAIISLTTPKPVADQPVPGWAEGDVPNDDASGGGSGPSSSDNVDLASGVFENSPGPDISAYNSIGPSASYERFYRSAYATAGYSSPGLSPGWVDCYDMKVTASAVTGSTALTLSYPNSGTEIWTPLTNVNGNPNGLFQVPQDAPYFVNGTYSGGGKWSNLTITWKDHTQQTFTPTTTTGLYRLTSIANIVGSSISINRDSTGRIQTIQNALSPPATLLSFNYSDGNLASVVAMDTLPVGATTGREVVYSYDSNGNLISSGQILDISSNGQGAARWQYQYQSLGPIYLLSSAQSPSPTGSGISSTSVTYDAFARAASHTDANGAVRNYEYGSAATLVQATSSSGVPSEQWTQNFAPNNINTGFVDANNKTAVIGYGAGNTQFLPEQYTNRNQQTSSASYDIYGNTLTATDPRGVQTINQYIYPTSFPLGELNYSYKVGTDPAIGDSVTGQSVVLAYLPNGLVSQSSTEAPNDVNGGSTNAPVTTSYSYDGYGNVTQTIAAGANGPVTTSYNYVTANIPGQSQYTQPEALNEPLTVTTSGADSYGQTTTSTQYFKYDARGDRTASVDALGNETDYSYDDAGDLIQTIYPPITAGGARPYSQLTYEYPGGPVTNSCLYSAFGVASNPFREIYYTYGSEGELLSVAGDTQPCAYQYDPLYRLSQMADGNGHVTQYSYDAVGNLSRVQYPFVSYDFAFQVTGNNGPNVDTFAYDADQNLIQKINGDGVVTSYTRNDPESQVTGIAYSHLNGANFPQFVNIEYNDPFGRPTSVADLTGSRTYTYDDLGDEMSCTTNFTGGPQNQTINYLYNQDGSRSNLGLSIMLTADGPSIATAQTYQYDGVGRIQTIAYPSETYFANSENYDYYANGWLKDDYLNGGIGSEFGGQGMPTAQVSYQYDPRGDVIDLTNKVGTPTKPLAIASEFTMLNPDGSSAYDAAGNRLSDTVTFAQLGTFGGGTQTYTYTYDDRNELTSVSPDSFGDQYSEDNAESIYVLNGGSRLINADNQDFTSTHYDGEGNPLFAANGFATFDPENHLSSITSSTTFTAGYDADGHRAWRNYNGMGATYFVYDGDNPVEEVGANGVVLALNGFGADGLRFRTSGPGEAGTYYTYDPQGNLAQRLSLPGSGYGGTPEVPNFWSAFGVHSLAPGTAIPLGEDQVGFGGQYGYYQDPTGLYLLGSRYYDPNLGRFLTRDTIGYQGGPNLYAYCGNNPITREDPAGTDAAGVGHHYIPNNVRAQYKSTNTEVYDVFNKAVTGPTDPPHNGANGHAAYTKSVGQLFEDTLKEKGKTAASVDVEDATDFVNKVKTSDIPEISNFLKTVYEGVTRKAASSSEALNGLSDGASNAFGVIMVIPGFLDEYQRLDYDLSPNDPEAQKGWQEWMKNHPDDYATLSYQQQHQLY